MLTIKVPHVELFDESSGEFVIHEEVVLELEHSLVSMSKWESIFEKPFLSAGEKTDDEALGYVEAMIKTSNFPEDICSRLSQDNLDAVNQYIDAKMTATWFNDKAPSARNGEVITNELIYYWMFSYSIPKECENWHLNRLFTLIHVFGVKNSKPKKMSHSEIAARNRALNEKRKAEMKTRG